MLTFLKSAGVIRKLVSIKTQKVKSSTVLHIHFMSWIHLSKQWRRLNWILFFQRVSPTWHWVDLLNSPPMIYILIRFALSTCIFRIVLSPLKCYQFYLVFTLEIISKLINDAYLPHCHLWEKRRRWAVTTGT
jgi:hypothetical protein